MIQSAEKLQALKKIITYYVFCPIINPYFFSAGGGGCKHLKKIITCYVFVIVFTPGDALFYYDVAHQGRDT